MTATYEYSTVTGLIVADTEDLLADVQGEFRSALGSALNVNSSTPQGALIQSETIARSNVMRNNAEFGNLINPNYSYGVALDALMALTGSDRGANQSTIVRLVDFEGNPQTFIARGSRMTTSDGNVFETDADITIGASGLIKATIKSVSFGDIAVKVEALKIVDGVVGWGAVRVTVDSVIEPGTARLSDGAARNMRMRRLFALGRSSTGAIKAALLKVPNVKSINVIEQNTGTPGTVNGVTFTLGSAMWVCVYGSPTSSDVAQALFEAHRGGCPWDYGNVGTKVDAPNGTIAVDQSTGNSYYVKWTKAVELDCWVKVVVKRGVGGANPEESIPQIVVAYAEGDIAGEEGFIVGQSVSGYDIAGSISAQMPGLFVMSVTVALTAAGSAEPAPGAYVPFGTVLPYNVAVANLGRVKVEFG